MADQCTCEDMITGCLLHPQGSGLKVYFNPLAFTDEQNQWFLAQGYEPAPIDQWKKPEDKTDG